MQKIKIGIIFDHHIMQECCVRTGIKERQRERANERVEWVREREREEKGRDSY